MIKNLNYEFVGFDSPTIVFLHGWGMDSHAFDRVVSKINPKQRILKLDFFSFGKSDSPENYFDTYEYAYYVFLLLSKLKINKIILVGHSFGGRIGIILSSVFGLEIKYLILTSSAGINFFDIVKSYKILHYKIKKFLVKIKLLRSNILDKSGSSDYKNLSKKLKINFIKIVNQDLRYLLKYIDIKTYLVWDKCDRITPYKICKFLKKHITNSKVVLYKSGRHFCYVSNFNKFSNLINDLLN